MHLLRTVRLLTATICLTLLGLASCQKPTEGITLVEGRVVGYTSRQPVGGATVQVWQSRRGGGYGAIGSGELTDAQGRFSFRFDADSEGGFIVKATAPPGYITDWGMAPRLTAGRRNKDLVVPMYAPAWVRLVLVDEPPKSLARVDVQGYNGQDRWPYPARDTIVIRPVLSDVDNAVTWWIYEGGQERKVTYPFQAGPLDTVTVRIPF